MRFFVHRVRDPDERAPVMQSLGCHVVGATPPHTDPSNQNNSIAGNLKRVCRSHPTPDPVEMDNLMKWVRNFLRTCGLVPLPPDSDTTVDEYLEHVNHPEWRKKELREAAERSNGVITHKDIRCKCFIKDETYTEFKHSRGIFSRTDAFKVKVGPNQLGTSV